MAVSAKMYGLFLKSITNKEVNLNSDSLKVLLCTSTYAPNQDTHQYKDVSITNEVAAGGGYTAGGIALTSVVCSYTAATNVLMLDAADVTWSASTITARYAVVYDDTPATSKPLIAYVDFGADVSSSGGNFTITWDTNGIATITAA